MAQNPFEQIGNTFQQKAPCEIWWKLLKQFQRRRHLNKTWFPDKFRVHWPFGSREDFQYRFSRWWPSWISNQNDFSYFWSTNHLDTSNEVSSQLAFWFRIKKFKIDFQPSWISDQNDFSYIYFWSTSHPDTSYQFSSQLALLIRTKLAIFDLQVT